MRERSKHSVVHIGTYLSSIVIIFVFIWFTKAYLGGSSVLVNSVMVINNCLNLWIKKFPLKSFNKIRCDGVTSNRQHCLCFVCEKNILSKQLQSISPSHIILWFEEMTCTRCMVTKSIGGTKVLKLWKYFE